MKTQTEENNMTPLEKARIAQQRMREEGITPITNPILKHKEKPNSRSLAIAAKCFECMGCTEEHTESGWRNMIRDCTSVACPPHSHRPFK